jgi:2,3-bisphosphoglycerate-independent phosphoglycerate mutase
MLKKILLIPVILTLWSCSVINQQRADTPTIKDQRISTDFTDEGVKIYYSFTGKLEKIEVFGQADAWKGNVEALAEADALAKLTKFVYGSEVATNRKVRLMGKAIEDAEEIIASNSNNSADTINTTDKQLEAELKSNKPSSTSSNTAQRTAKILNETLTETVTNITAKGKLVGVRKIADYKRNDGKTYVAVYQWSEKDLSAVENVRERMNKKSD